MPLATVGSGALDGSAAAARSTSGFRFVTPQTVLSTFPSFGSDEMSLSGEEGVSDGKVPMPLDADRYLVETVLHPLTVSGRLNSSNWLYFHPCGEPVDRDRPAANQTDGSIVHTNLAPLEADECVTLIGQALLSITLVAVEDDTPGDAYVATAPIDLVAQPVIGITEVGARGGGVPVNATAVVLSVGLEAPAESDASWSLVDCETEQSLEQWAVAPIGGFDETLFVAPLAAAGVVCFGSAALPVRAEVSRLGYLSPTATPTPEGIPYSGFVRREMPGFVAQAPTRLFDTRHEGAAVPSGSVYRHRLTGLPADATAVAVNITVTETTAPGFVTAYPCDAGSRPVVSNVNWTAPSATVPNFSIVKLGGSHELCFFVSSSAQVIADLSGTFVDRAGDGLVLGGLDGGGGVPARVTDTRSHGEQRPAGSVIVLQLDRRLPPDATAVVLNVTATDTAGPGFVTAYPCDLPAPDASNVNFEAGETRPNLVIAKVSSNGSVCLYTSAAAHLVVDLLGSFTSSSNIGFVAGEPFRVFDTRDDGAPLGPDEEMVYTFASPYLRAVAWNLTATETQGAGFVAGYPCGWGPPDVSNVNYTGAGQTVASFAILIPWIFDGELCLFALSSTHLIADEAGYFVAPVPWEVYYDGDAVG